MSRDFAYKTIDTLMAEVPGEEGDTHEQFIVRYGRYAGRRRGGPRLGDEGTDRVSFIIENVKLGLKVEDATLTGAKAKLRKLLVKKENFSGIWTLWMHVEAKGNYAKGGNYGKTETGHATIDTSFHLELVTKTPSGERVRHMSYDKEVDDAGGHRGLLAPDGVRAAGGTAGGGPALRRRLRHPGQGRRAGLRPRPLGVNDMQTHTITLKARVFSDEEDELVRQALDLLMTHHQTRDTETSARAKALLDQLAAN